MELYIDLEKSLNTSKLVKRAVQVKGKDGKTFTRMQWVDPSTGQVPSDMSHKEYVDHHVKHMSTDEKYDMMKEHNIEHKKNEHPQIDHKNKVMALKQHLYDNPGLVGAEHLPKHGDVDRTPTGTDKVNEWANTLSKKNPTKLYEMMKEHGIAESDPRHNADDKAAPIKHMHNMTKFKKHVLGNPHLMEGEQASVDSTPRASVKSKAEQGGNDVHGVLNSMSGQELYSLMKQHGIAESDPRSNPEDKAAPIKHMHNMMKLKRVIEHEPHKLNVAENGEPTQQEQSRLESMSDGEKDRQSVKDFLDSMPKDLKARVSKQYEDHPTMQKRLRSEHSHIDNMHMVSALRSIFENDPSLMDNHKSDVEHSHLMTMKIGNKAMSRVLRSTLGLKGVGDVKIVEDGVEWSFGTAGSSFVRREENDKGEPVLSVVDTGKAEDEWNEHEIPMHKVRDYLKGNSSDDTAKSLTGDDTYVIINGWVM